MTAPGLGPSARRYLAAVTVTAAAATLALALTLHADHEELVRAAAIAGAAAVCRFLITRSGPNVNYEADVVLYVGAALLLPAGLVAAAFALSGLAAFAQRRRAAYITLFNGANSILSALAATGAAALVPGGYAARGAAACCAAVAVNHVLLAVMLSLARRHDLRRSVLFTPASLGPDLALAAAGIALARLWTVDVAATAFVLMPLLVGARINRGGATRRTDAKTGLASPEALTEELEQEAERARRFERPVAVLALELAQAADGSAVAVASVLREVLRPHDVAARSADDRFAVLLPETDRVAAVAVAERIRAAVARLDAALAPSIGVAASPEDGWSAEELRAGAAAGADRARRAGGDRVATAPLRLSVLYS